MTGRVSLLVLLLLAGCGTTQTMSDAALVYCSAHRSDTIDAAVALGVVNSKAIGNRVVLGGSTVEFDEWRRTRQAEFERACNAVSEPLMRPPSPSSTPTWVSTLLTVLTGLFSAFVGARITWVTTNRREDRNRAKEHSVALRRASREFVDEVRAYADAQLKGPATTGELRRKRDLLTTQLAVTKLVRPEWAAPDVLRAELDAFGADVEQRWGFTRDRSERQPRADEVMKAVRELDRRIEVVVQALQLPSGDAAAVLDAEFGRVGAS